MNFGSIGSSVSSSTMVAVITSSNRTSGISAMNSAV
jgi:hypothetical protein